MYATDWSEQIPDDEEARFKVMAERLAALKASRDQKYGEKARALHRHAHAGVEARFVVRDDLPLDLCVGPFEPAATYKAYVRFSNGSWDRAKKDKPDVRGVAVKLVGVPGTKLLTGTEAPGTQDFLFIQGSTVAVTSPDEFVALACNLGQGEILGIFKLIGELGFGRAVAILRATLGALGKPFPSFALASYSSNTPFRFGPTAAKFALVPVSMPTPTKGGLTADLTACLRNGLAWDFRVQPYQDATRTPIEDPRVEWDAPFYDLGRLEIPPVDIESARGKAVAAYVEKLAFDPWHAVEELRPVGAMNRLRKLAYFVASAKERECVGEPDGTERFE